MYSIWNSHGFIDTSIWAKVFPQISLTFSGDEVDVQRLAVGEGQSRVTREFRFSTEFIHSVVLLEDKSD